MRYLIIGLLFCTTSHAGDSLNLSIPSSPGQYQSDSFRAGDLDCSMAIGSGTNVEFGVVGIINQTETTVSTSTNNGKRDVGVYARMTVPIGGPKTRLNCDTLYQLELQKKRMEIERMQQEIQNLRSLKFENVVR